MHVIKRHQVVGRDRRAIAPGPADRNAGVIKIMNEIVRDAIAGRLPNPDPDGAVKHLSAVVNVAIANFVGAALLGSAIYTEAPGRWRISFTDRIDAPGDSVESMTAKANELIATQIRRAPEDGSGRAQGKL